jgi:acetyltransferase-like isoleucine patch superfamily enzyme
MKIDYKILKKNIIKVVEKILIKLKKIKYKIRGKLFSFAIEGRPKIIYLGENLKTRGVGNIYINGNIYIGQRNRIETYNFKEISEVPKIIFNDGVSIEDDCHIASANFISFGKNVMVASKVYISDHSHGTTSSADLVIAPKLRTMISKGAIIIEDDVWIGEGASILAGVRIGRGSVIGANSVVTKNVQPYSVVGGIPAKNLHKERFEK